MGYSISQRDNQSKIEEEVDILDKNVNLSFWEPLCLRGGRSHGKSPARKWRRV